MGKFFTMDTLKLFLSKIYDLIKTKIDSSEKGQPNGVATLDENGKVADGQIDIISNAFILSLFQQELSTFVNIDDFNSYNYSINQINNANLSCDAINALFSA